MFESTSNCSSCHSQYVLNVFENIWINKFSSKLNFIWCLSFFFFTACITSVYFFWCSQFTHCHIVLRRADEALISRSSMAQLYKYISHASPEIHVRTEHTAVKLSYTKCRGCIECVSLLQWALIWRILLGLLCLVTFQIDKQGPEQTPKVASLIETSQKYFCGLLQTLHIAFPITSSIIR